MTEPPNRFADGAAYIAGAYVPIAEARIPILDRGFTRSDATYDVVHVWRGWFFRLEDHLDRFERNMKALRLDPGVDRENVRAILMRCVRLSGLRDSYVSMCCTRGFPSQDAPRDPRRCRNQLYCFAIPFVWIANEEQRRHGLKLYISGIPRIQPQSVDPTVKNFHWIDLTRGLFEALDAGADVEVLSDGAGHVTEGPGFNIFVVKDGRIATPAAGVFDGMTRRTVAELCADLGIAYAERAVRIEEVSGADEVFLSSTAGGIMPVSVVQGRPLGDGKPGPVSRLIHDTYWSRKEDGWLGTKVDYGGAQSAD
jgi:branched-chain amino acid aminotransferase